MPPKKAAPKNTAPTRVQPKRLATKKARPKPTTPKKVVSKKKKEKAKPPTPSPPPPPQPPVVAVDPYRPYRYIGVHVPFKDADANRQWTSDPKISAKGFIFIYEIRSQNKTFLVQSVETGKLYINKIVTPPVNKDLGMIREIRLAGEPCEDLRISTALQAKCLLPLPSVVRGVRRTYFSELALWQDIGSGTQSLFFNYYNGGSLQQLRDKYRARRQPIPEGFIWHVLLTLFEAVRFLQTGCSPGHNTDPPLWDKIYHRDIAANNVFIHYTERPTSENEPPEGFESNAFPEVVLGDFGEACIEGDPPGLVRWGAWDTDEYEEWQDTYGVFQLVKDLCLCHVPWGEIDFDPIFSPELINCDEINNMMSNHEDRYSQTLLDTLKAWEYTNCKDIRIDEPQLNASGDEVLSWELIPRMDYIINTVLPLARSQVRKWRKPRDRPADWFRSIDVSWTKPKRLLPYEWRPLESDPIDETIVRNIMYHDLDGGDGDDSNKDDNGDDDDNGGDSNDGGDNNSGNEGGDNSGGNDHNDDHGAAGDDESGGDGKDVDNDTSDVQTQLQNLGSVLAATPSKTQAGDKQANDSHNDKIPSDDQSHANRDSDVKEKNDHGSNSSHSSEPSIHSLISHLGKPAAYGKLAEAGDGHGDGGAGGPGDEDSSPNNPGNSSNDNSDYTTNYQFSPTPPSPPPLSHDQIERNKTLSQLFLERDYPEFRLPCRLVMLEFGVPTMRDIQTPPHGRDPRNPCSPPSSLSSLGDTSDLTPPSSLGMSSSGEENAGDSSGSDHDSDGTGGGGGGTGGTGGGGRGGGRGGGPTRGISGRGGKTGNTLNPPPPPPGRRNPPRPGRYAGNYRDLIKTVGDKQEIPRTLKRVYDITFTV